MFKREVTLQSLEKAPLPNLPHSQLDWDPADRRPSPHSRPVWSGAWIPEGGIGTRNYTWVLFFWVPPTLTVNLLHKSPRVLAVGWASRLTYPLLLALFLVFFCPVFSDARLILKKFITKSSLIVTDPEKTPGKLFKEDKVLCCDYFLSWCFRGRWFSFLRPLLPLPSWVSFW